tara:strand:+ start:733 stop:1116 length:384 start_codon:yes stop_codon:yes gene_type:complete
MNLLKNIKKHPKTILTIIVISIFVYIMLKFNLDVRAIAIITIILGFITNIYAGLIALIGLIPLIGPFIVQILSIPFFWFVNLMGYFTSFYAIKKGYRKEILNHRLVTTVLLFGIVLGYILGHLIPVR